MVAKPKIVTPALSASFAAPFAVIGISTNRGRVVRIQYLPLSTPEKKPNDELSLEVITQIKKYIENPKYVFTLPVDVSGTDYRVRVWHELEKIKPGQIKTYGEIAASLDSSPRAVGMACGDNKLPLLVPCHRVVAKRGVGGFMHSRGSFALGVKSWLLKHESTIE